MGLFSKKKKEMEREMIREQEMPSLPELPRLPDFPQSEDFEDSEYSNSEERGQLHKLPSLPSNSLGTKFSQNTIKEAVTGEEEDLDRGEYADDFSDDEEIRMMQEPLRKPMAREIGMYDTGRRNMGTRQEGVSEPVFIRIDKFEDALKTFGDTKRKISEIERHLNEIKKIKERETEELTNWENEIKSLKDEIEKVNRDIFSKI